MTVSSVRLRLTQRGQLSANRPLADRPPCPKCGDQTKLARVMPGVAEKGFIREFFECAKCNHLWEWEIPYPLTSAAGWIAGELKLAENVGTMLGWLNL